MRHRARHNSGRPLKRCLRSQVKDCNSEVQVSSGKKGEQ